MRWFFCAPDVRSLRGGVQQRASGDEEVGQSEKAVELGGVLGQAAVASLAVPEEVLEDVKGMFDPCPHLRLPTLKLHGPFFEQTCRHRFDFAALGCHVPFHAWTGGGNLLAFLHTQIARIGMGLLLAFTRRNPYLTRSPYVVKWSGR